MLGAFQPRASFAGTSPGFQRVVAVNHRRRHRRGARICGDSISGIFRCFGFRQYLSASRPGGGRVGKFGVQLSFCACSRNSARLRLVVLFGTATVAFSGSDEKFYVYASRSPAAQCERWPRH